MSEDIYLNNCDISPQRLAHRSMPHTVYQFIGKNSQRLYIGVTVNFLQRYSAHKSKKWWREVRQIRLRIFPNKRRALDAERALIFEHQPKYAKCVGKKYPVVIGLVEKDARIAELQQRLSMYEDVQKSQ